jgi:hypothetical protein
MNEIFVKFVGKNCNSDCYLDVQTDDKIEQGGDFEEARPTAGESVLSFNC